MHQDTFLLSLPQAASLSTRDNALGDFCVLRGTQRLELTACVCAAGLLACASSGHQQRAVCWGTWGRRGGPAAGGFSRLYSQPVEPSGGSGGGDGQAHLDPPRHCHLAGCQGLAVSEIVHHIEMNV